MPSDVVVVTGAGGMGEAIARRIGAGHTVVLADFGETQLADVSTRLEALGHRVRPVPADVSSAADVRGLARTAAELGTIRSVVHTAGVSPVQATVEQIVSVDVVGTAHVLDEFLPHVQPGTVAVCIASMAGTLMPVADDVVQALATTPTDALADLPALDPAGLDPGIAYALAKRGNQARVEAASIACGRRGGRVVSISPGVIATPMGRAELAGASGGFMRTMVEGSGTQRLGTPDDIAAVVEFLVSPAASFITGTDVRVDGGAVAAVRHGGALGSASS
ncbi:MAG TPA: SDR family oxidoreductase [Acidimicrobiia bacterium]|nr:SDR family oxidoreductase [Acidimicrobiia bacterium]